MRFFVRRAILAVLVVAVGCASEGEQAGGETEQAGKRGDAEAGADHGGDAGATAGHGGDAGATAGHGGDAGGAESEAGSAGAEWSEVGARCEDVSACGDGLSCFSVTAADFDGVGPAGGFCSLGCADDEDCKSAKTGANCVELVPGVKASSVCTTSCALGDKGACGGRDDLACWPVEEGKRACLPLCSDDSQCPSGAVCDASIGLCSSWVVGGGLELGARCDPAEAEPCGNGFCLELGDGAGICTAYCRRGTFPQCGGDPEEATCGWVFRGDEAAGSADMGMCTLACSCDDDCAVGLHCEQHPDREELERPGICVVGVEAGIDC